jgi:hypothetical protein
LQTKNFGLQAKGVGLQAKGIGLFGEIGILCCKERREVIFTGKDVFVTLLKEVFLMRGLKA